MGAGQSRIRALAAVALLVGAWAAWSPVAPAVGAHAAISCPLDGGNDEQLGDNDVDGDGHADTVVGLPNRSSVTSTAGALDEHTSRAGNHVIAGSAIAGISASKSFGAATRELYLNNDNCADVAVGDPGHAGGGVVDIVFGSETGLLTADAIQIMARTSADDYGSALAANGYQVGQARYVDLWIGAPGRTVGGLADAGAIDHYTISQSGAVTFDESITEASPAVHDQPQADNRFGSVLAWSSPTLVVGTPQETVDGLAGAGAVTILTQDPSTHTMASGQTFTQDSPGVPGGSEAGDRFGASVTAFGHVYVGVPGEDIGSIVDAGMVQEFSYANGAYAPGPAISQGTVGVPGVSEAGDQFGAALAAGTAEDQSLLWIGVPGEGLGDQPKAGDVIQSRTIYDDDTGAVSSVTYTTLRQGRGAALRGAYEAHDHVGQTLTSIPQDIVDSDNAWGVEIGDPGENLGTVVDAGVVIDFALSGFGTYTVTYVDNSSGPKFSQEYGAVVAGIS